MFGTFDRIRKDWFDTQLEWNGFHPQVVSVLATWSEDHGVHVVVSGEASKEMELSFSKGQSMGRPHATLFP